MRATQRPRVLVIGGGVAGAAFAAALGGDDFDLTLAEKAEFPRRKVCGGCIGKPGQMILEQLGVGRAVRHVSNATQRWRGYCGGKVIDVATPGGIAVCRSELDPILLSAASDRGCFVRQRTSVRIVASGDRHQPAVVEFDGHHHAFDLVVAASGLGGLNLTPFLPWVDPPGGPMGVAFHLRSHIDPTAIHMIIGDDGYVGAVQLPGGRIDVAAAIHRSDRSPITVVQQMIRDSPLGETLSNAEPLGDVMTTSPLRRCRSAANGRVIAIGDAHRYVEPFTGEGMTWALQSAVKAAEIVQQTAPESIASSYQRIAPKIASVHRRRCERMTSLIRHRPIRRLATWGLIRFPAMAKPIVRHLAN